MHMSLKSVLLSACLLAGTAHAAEPLVLNDVEMDSISAAGYSYVYGEAYAGDGTVSGDSHTTGSANPKGASVSRSRVVVKARGSDLQGYAEGGSGDGNVETAGYGAAAVDEGRLVIRVKTKVRTKSNGEVISRTDVKVKAKSKEGGSTTSKHTSYARSTTL